jgi:hypothetical protein
MIIAKTKTYNTEDYYLDSAKNYLTEWQMDIWLKRGHSKEQIERDIERAKREIKNVEEKTPYTTWHIDIPKGKNEFSIGNATYKIVSEEVSVEDYGWKAKKWKKKIYSVVKTNDVYSPFDEYILYYIQNIEKKQEIANRINNYFKETIQQDIEEKYLPSREMKHGGIINEFNYTVGGL